MHQLASRENSLWDNLGSIASRENALWDSLDTCQRCEICNWPSVGIVSLAYNLVVCDNCGYDLCQTLDVKRKKRVSYWRRLLRWVAEY